MDKYFVINNSDGDTYVRVMNKKQLLRDLQECKRGCIDSDTFENDTNYWGETTLIIKGQVVAPFEKRTIMEYDIE